MNMIGVVKNEINKFLKKSIVCLAIVFDFNTSTSLATLIPP